MDPARLERLGRHGDRFRLVRSLADRKGRRAAGRFVIEGENGVAALIASGHPADFLVAGEPLLLAGAADPLLERALARGIPVLAAPAELVDRLAFSDGPKGLLAVAPAPAPTLASLPGDRFAWCERAADPGNVGACLRTLAFFGFDALLLGPGSADPLNPKAVRATAGALFAMPCVTDVDPAALFAFAAARNLRPVAFDAHAGRPPAPPAAPAGTLLVFGPETGGLSRAVLDKCPEIVTLSAAGDGPAPVESLNLAAAVAVAAHMFRRD